MEVRVPTEGAPAHASSRVRLRGNDIPWAAHTSDQSKGCVFMEGFYVTMVLSWLMLSELMSPLFNDIHRLAVDFLLEENGSIWSGQACVFAADTQMEKWPVAAV